MNSRKQYPVFPTHEAARCFNCDSVLVQEWPDEEYPVGKHSAVCIGGCRMRTWYDLQETQVVDLRYAKDKLD